MSDASHHPFDRHPHRTLVSLSIPVLLTLVAEPVTGLVDTAFVARLGAIPLAALGVGTILLSSVFWIFNFLGIGTQTEVARAEGAGQRQRGREVAGLALALGFGFGLVMVAVGLPSALALSRAMGGEGEVAEASALYLRIRLWGAPAVIAMTVAFGALRGLQDMKTPFVIAAAGNGMNLVLDPILIFGVGPIPSFGIAGAATASVVSQVAAAGWAVAAVRWRLGLPRHLRPGDAARLLVVGRDLFLRTGLLTAFLLLTTRSATRIGAEAGAAHQAIRQFWLFTALLLDSFAHTAQSLVGYFRGAGLMDRMRRVASVTCGWSVGTGAALGLVMWATEDLMARLLVPEAAHGVFIVAWRIAAVAQPLNAVSFATDGIHWGTSDYRYLRNAMLLATAVGVTGLHLIDEGSSGALACVWVVTGGWIGVRAVAGTIRIWPGVGRSPFSASATQAEAGSAPPDSPAA